MADEDDLSAGWEIDYIGALAGDAVLGRFDNCVAYADNAYDKALEYLDTMRETAGTAYTPDAISLPDVVEPNLDPAVIAKPDTPDTTFTDISVPSSPLIEDITIDAISGIPAFDVPALVINLPAQPDMPAIPDVGEPAPIENIPLPTAPSYVLPTLPTLQEAQVPSPPDQAMPPWEGTMPVDDLIIPTNTFNFSEGRYTSDLLEAAKLKLQNDVENGGTGLGADIETAIWDRNTERDAQAMQEAKDRIMSEWAERGFMLPDGVLTTMLLDVEKQYLDTRQTTSRDIAVKQAELALQNTQFAVQQSIALESQLIAYSSQIAERQLQSAKYLIDASIAIFNAAVTKYNANLDAYKTQAVVYETRVRAALAQAEIYKTQIEAAKLTLDMNDSRVELYKAQLVGVEQLINCYRTEMEAAKVKADVERLKLEAFKTRIDAYQAIVNLNVAEFNCYDSAIRGEATKAQIYATQVEGYKSRLEGVRIEAAIANEKAQIQSELAKNKTVMYASDIEAYKSRITAEKTRIEAIIQAYQGAIEMYKAESATDATRVESAVKAFSARVQKAAAETEALIKDAEISLTAFTESQKLKGVLVESGSKVAAQLAASAMAATNASVSLGESDSKSVGYRGSRDVSYNHGTSLSTTNTTHNSTSQSTDTNYNYNYSS
jgi:hypothetical protein